MEKKNRRKWSMSLLLVNKTFMVLKHYWVWYYKWFFELCHTHHAPIPTTPIVVRWSGRTINHRTLPIYLLMYSIDSGKFSLSLSFSLALPYIIKNSFRTTTTTVSQIICWIFLLFFLLLIAATAVVGVGVYILLLLLSKWLGTMMAHASKISTTQIEIEAALNRCDEIKGSIKWMLKKWTNNGSNEKFVQRTLMRL